MNRLGDEVKFRQGRDGQCCGERLSGVRKEGSVVSGLRRESKEEEAPQS